MGDFDQSEDKYRQHMTDLLEAKDGRVFIDAKQPRVCLRGPEVRSSEKLGYEWLPDEEVFPYYEMRAAAMDCRELDDGSSLNEFSEADCDRRVAAQLDTLIEARVRHVVLSAFGCGAFENPPEVVAECYRQALDTRKAEFECVAFAIFYPGYGGSNLAPFEDAFAKC